MGFVNSARKARYPAGYSLLELTIVVLITGILAVVMIPDFSATDHTALDLAAGQYADAIRFTRAESIRTGQPYAYRVRDDVDFIKVKSIDQTTSPWSLIWDVYHPISKKLYKIDLKQQSATRNITTSLSTSFRGTCNKNRNIYFDIHGAAWCADPETTAVDQYDIIFTLGSQSRTVSIDGMTGRVTVQ